MKDWLKKFFGSDFFHPHRQELLELEEAIREARYQESIQRDNLLNDNWHEFLLWVQDSRQIRNVALPYEYWKEITDGTARYVPLANESNFWQWYLEYKLESNGSQRT